MQNRRAFLGAGTLAATALVTTTTASTATADTGCALGRQLLAHGPDPAHRDQLELFGRLVGEWDMRITNTADDGSETTTRGWWVFGWVLQGRAVQDVLWDERNYLRGSTLRQYDPAADTWHIAWFGPDDPAFVVADGGLVGDEVVLVANNLPFQLRWVFADVERRSFRWRAEVLYSDGWHEVVRMLGTRRR